MFERYTEKARRTIFFARYEASQFGSGSIESEHLLLGLLHEHERMRNRQASGVSWADQVRSEVVQRKPPGPITSTSVDLPLSPECIRALGFAAEQASRLKHEQIRNEHLLFGLLREEKCLAAELLRAHGMDLEEARKDLSQ